MTHNETYKKILENVMAGSQYVLRTPLHEKYAAHVQYDGDLFYLLEFYMDGTIACWLSFSSKQEVARHMSILWMGRAADWEEIQGDTK